MAPGEPAVERDSFGEVVLVRRLREAIRRLNLAIPEEAREESLWKVLRFLSGQPAKQAETARKLFEAAAVGEVTLEVSPVIVAETLYTLISFYEVG